MKAFNNFPFIVDLIATFQTPGHLIFVMDACLGGELNYIMTMKEFEVFREDEIRFYSVQIGLALDFIHKNKIIYRDLKLENIVMCENGYIKLIDFGL